MSGGPVRELVLDSAQACRDAGRRLGEVLGGGEVIALVGELGAGKTTLTRGIVEGIGGDGSLVSSPTYVLENVYPGPLTVHHFDAYRLRGEEELLAIGFDERVASGGVVVLEWADRVPGVLPSDHLFVQLLHSAGGGSGVRRARFSGRCPGWERFIAGSGENG